jgi:hypothetical protein
MTRILKQPAKDQFATQPIHFQLNNGQSNTPVTDFGGGSYKEYVGMSFFKGILCPAWLDNSNSTGNNPDGSASKFDIYCVTVPY